MSPGVSVQGGIRLELAHAVADLKTTGSGRLICRMKITEYKIIVEHADVIEKKINELIKQGWQPFGTPFVLPPSGEMLPMNTVFQAMVQTEKE